MCVWFCVDTESLSSGGDSFLFQAEDGIRYLVRSRGLGDVYKRQARARSILSIAVNAPLSLMNKGIACQNQGASPS